MDLSVMHNLIHSDYGNDAARCPVCTGEISSTDNDALLSACNDILKRKQSYMAYSENGRKKGIKTDDVGYLHPYFKFSDSGDLPSEIMLVPTGKWNTTKYGPLEVTFDDIEEMAKNFKKGIRKGVMIDIDHGGTQHGDAAAGWINEVEARADGLWATKLEWTELGKDMVSKKIYKFLSPEFSPTYADPETSEVYDNVLIATSLVNRPLLKEIPAVAASENSENLTSPSNQVMLFLEPEKQGPTMNREELLKKQTEGQELTQEEKDFLAQNPETPAEQPTPETPAETPETPSDEAIAAKESTVTISATELTKLKEQAEQGQKAFKELEKTQLTQEVNQLTFNEKGGKIPPASVAPIVELMITMSDTQKTKFKEILNSLPEKRLFGEVGSSNAPTNNQAADQLNVEIKNYAQEKNMKFSEALVELQKTNPEKFAGYRESLTK